MKLYFANIGLFTIFGSSVYIVKGIYEISFVTLLLACCSIVFGIILIKPYYYERCKSKPMKTVADFKRRIQPGIVLNTIYHKKLGGYTVGNQQMYENADLGNAPVKTVKSTQFSIERIKHGEKVESWIDFPKASQCKIVNSDTIQIYEKNSNNELDLILTYTFVTQNSSYEKLDSVIKL